MILESGQKIILTKLNSYGDGKCDYRIGNYIDNLLKAFDEGLFKDKAINIANKNFSSQWGEKKSVNFK